MAKVEDLDALRPQARFIKLGGNEIDVSFIPCGITFDVDQIMQELVSITNDEIVNKPEVTKRAFELSIKLCATFCSYKYPELDEKYFMDNCGANQIKAFTGAIKDALSRAYEGIEKDNSKNLNAAKSKKK